MEYKIAASMDNKNTMTEDLKTSQLAANVHIGYNGRVADSGGHSGYGYLA